VSQATLFNYFANKGALAEAWVRGEIAGALGESASDLADRGLRSAMRALCRRVAEVVSVEEDFAVRLEAWRECGRAHEASMEATEPLVLALRRWQESERIRKDVDALTMAELLIEAIESGLISGLRQQSSAKALSKRLQAGVDLVLDGSRKRNERVAAPRSADSTGAWTKRPVQSR
jgi:AcrR family transcriptional regulator